MADIHEIKGNDVSSIAVAIPNQELEEREDTVVVPMHVVHKKDDQPKRKILRDSGSVFLQSLLLGGHLAANGKMLSMLSDHETGASSIVSTFQSTVIGTLGGLLYATGIEFAKPIAQENSKEAGDIAKARKEAGDIAKASWVLSLGLGSIATAAMLTTPYVFPLLCSNEAAKPASEFFLGYAASGIPAMMLLASPQIAFQTGEWYIPLACGAMFYIPAGAISYLLAFPGNMGALGVGLGGSIAGWTSTAIIQGYLSKEHYSNYQLYKLPTINDLKRNLPRLLKTGAQISLQRLTEWGNLFFITTVMGNSKYLAAASPGIQCTSVFAIAMQGLAHASTMLILQNKEKIELAIKSNNKQEVLKCHKKNIHTLLLNNMAGAMLSAVAAGFCYWGREPLSNFFIAPGTAPDIKEAAEELLWINMLGLIPDAIRMISLGALRSWKDVIRPTLACLATMTAIGVPIGAVVSHQENDDWSYMFIIRDAVITLSAAMMAWRCKQKIQNDKVEFLTRLSQPKETTNLLSHIEEPIQCQNTSNSMLTSFSKSRQEQPSLLVQSEDRLSKNDIEDDSLTEPLLKTNKPRKFRCSVM